MSKAKYYTQLDAIRAIAAFGIITLHWLNSNYINKFGIYHESNWHFWQYGVQMFFVLSGFLISDILIKNKNASNKAKIFKNFFVRRILRLFPIYYLLVLVLVILKDEFVIQHLFWFLSYTANIKFYLEGGLVDVWSNHMWTLSIEEQFYLILPFLMVYTPKKFELFIPLTLISIALVYKSLNSYGHPHSLLLHAQTDTLGMGVLLAVLKNRYPKYFDFITGRAAKFLLLIGFILSLVLFYTPNKTMAVEFHFNYILVLTFGLLIANTTTGFGGLLGKIFENKVLVYLGKITYGLYLYHKIIPLILLIFINKLDIVLDNLIVYYLVNMFILLVVTHFSWKLIEMPILKLKSRFEYRVATPPVQP
jgi:peptidoglycan/LPS O-acetylase OafA/YrhL